MSILPHSVLNLNLNRNLNPTKKITIKIKIRKRIGVETKTNLAKMLFAQYFPGQRNENTGPD